MHVFDALFVYFVFFAILCTSQSSILSISLNVCLAFQFSNKEVACLLVLISRTVMLYTATFTMNKADIDVSDCLEETD